MLKFKKIFSFFSLVAFVLTAFAGMTACSDSDDPDYDALNQVNTGLPEKAPRSVLVYMAADNSLGASSFDRENLADMIKASADGLLGNSRLIIYHDRYVAKKHGENDENTNEIERPALKEVTPKGLRILKYYEHTPHSTSVERIQEVIRDFKMIAPAERYGLIYWSHSTAWPFENEKLKSRIMLTSIGEDDGHKQNIPSLAEALDGQGFDYIYFDCCHMASVECLYELRNVADKFAGSVTELPGDGMPYYLTLPYLMPKEADLEGAAAATFAKYDALTGAARTCTMSVINAASLERLADATRKIYEQHPVLPAGYAGQAFERSKRNGDPCFLFDFENYITALYANNSNPAMRQAYAEWLLALGECVSYSAYTPTVFERLNLNTCCGLSTYILRKASDADTKGYNRLQWYGDVASYLFNNQDGD